MFDQFVNQQPQHSMLKTIDYRNAKYHGYTLSNEPQGLGMALDHHYLLAISQWHQAIAQGPTFVMYPDASTFYGNVLNELPNQLCTFTNKRISFYVNFIRGSDIIIAIDSVETKTLHFIRIAQKTYQKLIENTNENYLLQEYLRDQRQEKVILLGQKSYTNLHNQVQQISHFFQQQLEHKIGYQSFIKQNFVNEKALGLEIVESKQDFSFQFKHTSITCKLSNSQPLTIKSVGYYNDATRQMQLQRKDLGTANIEQLIDHTIFQYPKMPAQRPFDCLTYLHQYYKKSLDFKNQYFCVDYIYRIKFIFHSIQQLFSDITVKCLAQQLLENPKQADQKRSKAQPYREEFSMYAIDQVREDVYRAARKKSTGHISLSSLKNNSSLYLQNPRTHEIARHTINHSFSFKEKKPTIYQQVLSLTTPQKQRKEVEKYQNTPKMTSNNYQPKRYSNNGTPLYEKIRPSPLSKYAYLDEESIKLNERRITNIKTLTEYYQDVQRDTRSKMFNDKCLKSTSNWQESPSTGFKQSNQKFIGSPNGPKRMLKYGWD